MEDARKYLPELFTKRKIDPSSGLATLDRLQAVVQSVPRNVYEPYEKIANERIGVRDPNDWPVAALALVLDLPIWTHDQDFFGSGIATWTTDRVEIYLRQ